MISIIADVTRQKQDEEVRRRNQQRLRLITEQLPAILWTTNPDLVVSSILANERMRLPADRQSFLDRNLLAVLESIGATKEATDAYPAALSGDSASFDLKSGDAIFAVRVDPLYEGDRITGTISIAHDVTEQRNYLEDRKQRVRELTCLEQISRLALEQDDSIDAFLQSVAVVLPSVFRYPQRAHARIRLPWAEFTSDTHAGEGHAISERIVVSDGDDGAVEVTLDEDAIRAGETPFLESERTILSIIAARVASALEHYETSQEAERHNRRFSAVFSSALDAMALVDHGGVFLDVNPSTCATSGYSEAELLAMTIFDLIAPDAKEDFRERWLEMPPLGNLRRECEITRKDGTRVTWDCRAVADVQPGLNLVVARDVTERATHEREIEASLTEKETLIKEIHHRVRNNLQLIASMLAIQSMQTEGPEIVEVLSAAGGRIRSLSHIYDLLLHGPGVAEVEMNEYLAILTESLSAAIEKEVTLQVDSDPIKLHLDLAVPCGLILNELVSNSVKHAFPNRDTGTIWISMRRHDEGVVLTVRDSGVGIENTDVEAYETVGMMLIRTLVAQLDGTVRLESNEGTTVTIRFTPRAAPSQPALR